MNHVKKKTFNKKYKTLLIACGISVLSGVCLLTTILIMTVIPMTEGIFFRMTIPTLFSLVVLPIFLAKLFRFDSKYI
ncbi:hypothetical protein [Melissococcus plutonius]|uniref:hypothetical protein n=1 Tax=Melissococcus plutonius TaxID=33970 RepID=UPI00059CF9FA|nr:hypothetical protein [Melissococcus plutonius]AIM25436.1 hypothetical protein MEPL_c000540 [Melissococcus plutonius S1]KMT25716.1 hypothetical protein MEPL2_1c00550 [Melissococcus plutonius]KMT27061.1 hypothetical protein MEPL3_1c00820 [Melissococcus plutonius]KMT28437.1 hypothetical protein MEPL1_1c00530 [Melissococcus plutonius]KMT29899.1 hypothetical protein MEPL4_2c00010 [Melissococcus plutonius]